MPGQRLWQQAREVNVGGKSFVQDGGPKDIDMDIEVGFGENSDTSSFTVTLWNLAKDTWRDVKTGEICEIKLGWSESGPSPETVMTGKVNKRYTETQQQDRKYILEGQDQSDERLNVKFSHTWQNQPPDTIAKFIAGEIDLGVGKFDSVGSPIEGYWAIKKDKPVKYWINQLTKEAGKLTGEQWTYFADAGKLYFKKKDTKTREAIDINKYNAISVDTASGKTDKSSDGNEIEFEAYLDPRLSKHRLVNINTTDVSGIYNVKSYDYTSSTENGDHLMSGTATEPQAEYQVSYPGTPRGAVRAYRQSP